MLFYSILYQLQRRSLSLIQFNPWACRLHHRNGVSCICRSSAAIRSAFRNSRHLANVGRNELANVGNAASPCGIGGSINSAMSSFESIAQHRRDWILLPGFFRYTIQAFVSSRYCITIGPGLVMCLDLDSQRFRPRMHPQSAENSPLATLHVLRPI